MAELKTIPPSSACCSPTAQESCCEPEAKSECCGEGPGCGCAAGAGTLPIACSLGRAELAQRAELLRALGGRLVALDAEGPRATLRFSEAADELRNFVAAESTCCPFFRFELSESGGLTDLRIAVPEDGEDALRGLVAGFVSGWEGLVAAGD